MAEAPVVRHCKLLTFKRFLVTGIDVNSIGDLEQGDGPILHGGVDGHLNSLLKKGLGEAVIDAITEYTERVPKVGALIFALAYCSCFREDRDVTNQAYAKLNEVCRIPTHLFQFVSIQQQLVEARRRHSNNFISRRLKRVSKRRLKFSDSGFVSASSSSAAGSQETEIFCKKSTGWGTKRKKGIASFYTDANKDALRLLYLVTKYKRRHNWSHADILLFTHLKFSNLMEGKELVLTYSRYGYHHKKYISLKSRMSTSPVNETVGRVIDLIDVLEKIKALTPDDDTENIDTLCNLIEKYGKLCCEEEWENVCYLYGQMNCRNNSEEPRKSFGICKEHVPTKFFQYPEVWRRLLPNMALGCMIRNLSKMTELEIFDDQENVNRVTSALRDPEILKRARIHPLSILIALHTYQKGESDRSKSKWNPNLEICGALDEAFHQSFKSVQLFLDNPTNKKFYLAIDCSTIMKESECCHCDVISPVVAAAALTLVMRKMETHCQVVAFGEDLADNVPIADTISETVTQITEYAESNNLGKEIDPTVVIQNARDEKIDVDVFIFFTACKGIKGDATDMLQKYRSTMNKPDAKLIVCAMSCNDETVVQPNDPFVLHVCGFDQNMLTIIHEFVSLSRKKDCPCCRVVENDEEDSEGDD